MSVIEKEISRLFMIVAMSITSDVVNFQYKNAKIGRGIFIIDCIGLKQQCTMKDIIDHLKIKASTATRQVDRLVDLKLVQRITPDEDRRTVVLTLTGLGKEAYQFHEKMQTRNISGFLDGFAEEELEVIARLLRIIAGNNRVSS